MEDQPPEDSNIRFPDPVSLKPLAAALRRKPFQIIADLMELGQFKNVDDTVTFETASKIALKYGFHATKAT